MNNIRGPLILENGVGTPVSPGGYFGFGQTTPVSDINSSGPRLYSGVGSPNGTLTAPIGSFWFESATGAWYRNTDGATAWQLMTPGGTGTLAPTYLVYDSGYLAAPAASIDTAVAGPAAITWNGTMPTGTQHLYFKLVSKGSDAATYQRLLVALNNDAVAANYQSTRSLDDPAVGVLTSPIARLAASRIIGSTPCAGTVTATKFGLLEGTILFNSSTHLRQVVARSADHREAAGEENIAETTVEWANGAVVTRLAFAATAGNLIAGSRLMVYAQ